MRMFRQFSKKHPRFAVDAVAALCKKIPDLLFVRSGLYAEFAWFFELTMPVGSGDDAIDRVKFRVVPKLFSNRSSLTLQI